MTANAAFEPDEHRPKVGCPSLYPTVATHIGTEHEPDVDCQSQRDYKE
jgi:hypothetical protein